MALEMRICAALSTCTHVKQQIDLERELAYEEEVLPGGIVCRD